MDLLILLVALPFSSYIRLMYVVNMLLGTDAQVALTAYKICLSLLKADTSGSDLVVC